MGLTDGGMEGGRGGGEEIVSQLYDGRIDAETSLFRESPAKRNIRRGAREEGRERKRKGRRKGRRKGGNEGAPSARANRAP
jgi:hypothetical protein